MCLFKPILSTFVESACIDIPNPLTQAPDFLFRLVLFPVLPTDPMPQRLHCSDRTRRTTGKTCYQPVLPLQHVCGARHSLACPPQLPLKRQPQQRPSSPHRPIHSSSPVFKPHRDMVCEPTPSPGGSIRPTLRADQHGAAAKSSQRDGAHSK